MWVAAYVTVWSVVYRGYAFCMAVCLNIVAWFSYIMISCNQLIKVNCVGKIFHMPKQWWDKFKAKFVCQQLIFSVVSITGHIVPKEDVHKGMFAISKKRTKVSNKVNQTSPFYCLFTCPSPLLFLHSFRVRLRHNLLVRWRDWEVEMQRSVRNYSHLELTTSLQATVPAAIQ